MNQLDRPKWTNLIHKESSDCHKKNGCFKELFTKIVKIIRLRISFCRYYLIRQ